MNHYVTGDSKILNKNKPKVTILKRNGNCTNLGTIFRNAEREDIDSVFKSIEPREIRRIF